MKQKLNRKIIRRIILEEAAQIRNERKKNFLLVKKHALMERKLIDSGLSLQESKEIVLNEFFDAGGDALKFMFIDWICDQLGFETNSFFGKVVKNTIENFEMGEVYNLIMGEGDRCDILVENLADGLIEAIGDHLLELIGTAEVTEQGVMMSTVREVITNFLKDNAVAESLKSSIKGVVCNFSFNDLLSGITGGSSGSDSGLGDQLGGLFSSLASFMR